jgi:oligoendopeptidase F
MEARAHQLIIKFSSAWSFLVPEILQLDEKTIQIVLQLIIFQYQHLVYVGAFH